MRPLDLPSFDLTNVLSQLQHKDPTTWDPQSLGAAELEYRRFLALSKLLPGQKLVPSSLVDEVWHRHILNTAQYASDCRSYFGHMLHHNPSQVPGGDRASWAATLAAYREFFGEEPGALWVGGSICDAGGCDTCNQEIASSEASV
jgi:hypothetical protein